MSICWKCNKEIPAGSTTCPHCQASVSKNVVDNMMTIGPGGAPASQILPGVTVAGRYEVKQEIGRGGMGIVYLAHDVTMEHDVALKVIPQELCMDPKAVADLKRETSIALKLSHPHIMRLHTLDTWEGQAFVVMELVDGGTLAHMMAEKGVLSLKESLPLLKQMAEAIDYSHSSDPAVVHRDLKPLNILLTRNGEVKIADYGLARVLRDSASRISNQDSAGTLSYMAPEQVLGEGIGTSVDIYALAAITYEMLSGNPPFYTGDLRYQILHKEVSRIGNQPDYVNNALLNALSKDREDRPETAAEFVAQLAGEQEVIKKPKKKKKQGKVQKIQAGRNRSLAGLLAGGVLLLCILAGAGYFLSGSSRGISLLSSEPILTVNSDPAGAIVYVDDGEVGESPVEIAELPNGTHTVRIEKKKYSTYNKKVFIQQDTPVNLEPRLIPEPYGDIQISTTPPGAVILVDGEKKGRTPATLEHLPKGSRKITLQKEEYDTWQGSSEIIPFETAELNVDLTSIYGSLEISSTPSGAAVLINGKAMGTTPFSSDRIRRGKHAIRLEKKNFDPWEDETEVRLDATAVVNADLVTILGTLNISSSPEAAVVYLDGVEMGRTPLQLEGIKKGRHQLKLKKKDHDSWTKEIHVTAGQGNDFAANLESRYGILKISSSPPGATVSIDGKKIGKTPLQTDRVRKGKRKLRLTLANYYPWGKEYVFPAGKSKSFSVNLKAIPQVKSNWTDPVTGMEFVFVGGGCFQMGDNSDVGNSDEKPVHEVCVDDFWIGKYELTQGQYQKVMGSNPSNFKNGSNFPVENVSWYDAQDFARKLSGRTGKAFRLPTEAEWEYAARSGGKNEKFAGGNSVDSVAWYSSNSNRSTHPVGNKFPNNLGVYDMSGNVWEWCSDWYGKSFYKSSPRNNPKGASSGSDRVIRGGSWLGVVGHLRAANRDRYKPNVRMFNLGFRLVFPESSR